MKDHRKLIFILNIVAAMGFFLATIIGKNMTFLPLGCVFLILGLAQTQKPKPGQAPQDEQQPRDEEPPEDSEFK